MGSLTKPWKKEGEPVQRGRRRSPAATVLGVGDEGERPPGFWMARGAPGVETRPLRYSGGAMAQRSFAAAAAQGALLRSERGGCGG